MTTNNRLAYIFRVILDEAAQNPAFASRLEEILAAPKSAKPNRSTTSAVAQQTRRRRRSPAVLNPIRTFREGEDVLRDQLGKLNLEQLRDIIAEYRMDPDNLAMRWKSPNRLVERIVELARGRATKGDAFRA